ncbi:MAG: N-formylglutamate amidohydrolase [Phenylobacterium sp.]|uniref:N-formylglutamate amidohydrolase n=1 Tax=Phenylobacterium sp. TaxID=1871053 RepID=UPI0027340E22|nr:N-formylglutamate amidohydrolase [Phenylobacterium sp.]MDP3745721.1 N-formylglutamate amidohydrolase [Phenylobacterium sp.]
MSKSWADSASPSNLLLGQDDLSPVVVANRGGRSPFLLLGDHAGRAIPRRLGDLGLTPAAMDRHIAWDIGVAGLGARLSEALDAVFIRQAYSRLVIDCNRRPGAAGSIPETSDDVAIPGNAGLCAAEIATRHDEVYLPYQDAIAAELDRRAPAATLLVSLHSFTPVFLGQARPWRMGVLHRGDSRLSDRMLALLRRELGAAAGDNQPYRMDEVDNTVPLHAHPRGLDYLELEVRQDLIADSDGQAWAASLLAALLTEAVRT